MMIALPGRRGHASCAWQVTLEDGIGLQKCGAFAMKRLLVYLYPSGMISTVMWFLPPHRLVYEDGRTLTIGRDLINAVSELPPGTVAYVDWEMATIQWVTVMVLLFTGIWLGTHNDE